MTDTTENESDLQWDGQFYSRFYFIRSGTINLYFGNRTAPVYRNWAKQKLMTLDVLNRY